MLISNMKRLLFSILFIFCAVVVYAQQPERGHGPSPRPGQRPNFEKYLQDRVSFVTKVMGLAPADSAQFVPLYREMLKEKGELMFKRPRQRIRIDRQYPDSVYQKAAEGEINYKLEDAKIEMKYLEKFEKFLSPKQVFGWIQAEKMFIGSFMRNEKGIGQNGGPNAHPQGRPNGQMQQHNQ